MNTFWEIVAHVPATVLRLDLTRRNADVLASTHCTVHEIERFLGHPQPRRTTPLSRAFNTPTRIEQLKRAYDAFERQLLTWIIGPRRDSRLDWVTPALEAPSIQTVVFALTTATPNATMARDTLTDSTDSKSWLPMISLEGARVMRSLANGDRAEIEVAMARLSRLLKLPDTTRPWLANCPDWIAALPLSCLGAYPERRVGTLVTRLATVGYVNIGHLRALHPESIDFISGLGELELAALRRSLQV